MSWFDDMLEADAVNVHTATDRETIGYTRHGQAEVEIQATVFREEVFDPSTNAKLRIVRVFVPRASIASVNINGDKLRVAMRQRGAERTDCRPTALISEDAGGFLLLVQ
jgi:hypothetical protein